MFDQRAMTDDERAELEDMLYTAAFTGSGETRKTGEAARHLFDALYEHAENGNGWADALIADAARDGLRSRITKWTKSQTVVEVPMHGRKVRKSGYASVTRQTEQGREYQYVLFATLTLEQAHAGLLREQSQIAAQQVNVSMYQASIDLMLRHGVESMPEALTAAGITFEQFIDGIGGAA